jgi:hypothetical protein
MKIWSLLSIIKIRVWKNALLKKRGLTLCTLGESLCIYDYPEVYTIYIIMWDDVDDDVTLATVSIRPYRRDVSLL